MFASHDIQSRWQGQGRKSGSPSITAWVSEQVLQTDTSLLVENAAEEEYPTMDLGDQG